MALAPVLPDTGLFICTFFLFPSAQSISALCPWGMSLKREPAGQCRVRLVCPWQSRQCRRCALNPPGCVSVLCFRGMKFSQALLSSHSCREMVPFFFCSGRQFDGKSSTSVYVAFSANKPQLRFTCRHTAWLKRLGNTRLQ